MLWFYVLLKFGYLLYDVIPAHLNDAMEQIEGQIASGKINMARLLSPQLYDVLSGNVLSLYANRLVKLVNKKGKLKSSLVFDEFLTIYLNEKQ
jgi:hypothetical protein